MEEATMTFDSTTDVRALVAEDFDAVDQLINKQLESNVPLIKQICQHLIHSGGKRLRPLLVLLVANALGYEGKHHIAIAAIIEFIHTATLLHDDVIDSSKLRRGSETANAVWGNAPSILTGDFLYTRTFQMLAEIGDFEVFKVLSALTNIIPEGEMIQLMNRNDPSVTEENYMNVIRCKTAALFQAATELAAIISETEHNEAMAKFGSHLGIAFQLVDDALDYSGDSEALGKNVGDDLAEGKATLPLIFALKHANAQEKSIIENAIVNGGLDDINAIMAAIEHTNALEYTFKKAREHAALAEAALTGLPVSNYKQALIALTQFSVARTS